MSRTSRIVVSAVLCVLAELCSAQTWVGGGGGKGCQVGIVAGPEGKTCMRLQAGCSIAAEKIARAKFAPPLGTAGDLAVDSGALVVCDSGTIPGTEDGTIVTSSKTGRSYRFSEKTGGFVAARSTAPAQQAEPQKKPASAGGKVAQ